MKKECRQILRSLTGRVRSVGRHCYSWMDSGARIGCVDGIGMSAETARASETTHGGAAIQNGPRLLPNGSMPNVGTICSVQKSDMAPTSASGNGLRTSVCRSTLHTATSVSVHSVQSDCMEQGTPCSSRLTMSTTTDICPDGVVAEVQGPTCTESSFAATSRTRTSCSVSRATWAKRATAASAHISIQTVHRLGSNPVPCKRLAGEARPSAAFTADEDIVSSARRRAAALKGGSVRSVAGRTSSQDGGNQLLIYAGMIYGIKKTRFNGQDYATVVCSTWAQPTQPAIP